MNKKQIIFICGALRSGSSLTHLMLDSHSKLKNPGEFDFIFDKITDDGTFPPIIEYNEWLSSHRIFQSKSLVINKRLSFPQLIYSFINQLSESDSLLTLNVHRSFDRISYLFPNAKYVHLIRDPRDVARSSIGMGWAGNVYHGVDHWLQTEQSWKRLICEISAEQYIEIRFEDLILSPHIVLKKACEFIGVPYSNEMFDYANDSTYSRPDPLLVSQWKKNLSIKEIQYVETKAHLLMTDLSYELSGYPIITLNFFEKNLLKLTNKIFKLRFSIKRHGIILFIEERLSRFLNLKAINKRIRLAMNETDKQYLK